MERERKREIREKRRLERDAQLGLDMVDEEMVEEQRAKKRSLMEQQEIEEEQKRRSIKGGVIAPLPNRHKSSSAKMVNDDLRQVND